MPNRFHTPFSKQRIHGSKPPKDPKGTGPAAYKENPFSWSKVNGPRGTDLNRKAKFPRVKNHAVKDNF